MKTKLDLLFLFFIAAAVCEPQTNERGSSLISRRLHYKGLQSLFLTKRKELWLCANGRVRMRSGMPRGIVVMLEWEDLGCPVMWRKELSREMKLTAKAELNCEIH